MFELRLPDKLSWPVAVVLGAGCILQHYANLGQMEPNELPRLMASMTNGEVGEVKVMRRVLHPALALAWGTGPFPASAEAFVEVSK